MAFIPASLFLQQNVLALIEGRNSKISACALSTVTGIPLIRLHGGSRSLNGCEKAVQMSAGYRDYAHATREALVTCRRQTEYSFNFTRTSRIVTIHPSLIPNTIFLSSLKPKYSRTFCYSFSTHACIVQVKLIFPTLPMNICE